VGVATPVDLRTHDPRVEEAVITWRSRFRGAGSLAARPGRSRISVAIDESSIKSADGYRLDVRPDRIEIVGGADAGCFYAIQTLRQLSCFETGEIPCCTVVDWPDFRTRGLLHDVTRGKVPTLDTLKLIVDRLAALKVNQLQLNIEHAFVFSFDTTICQPSEGLTPDEVLELDKYARDRFIALVPALATLGHMGRILSMPKYRHLAEVEPLKAWSEMTWPERLRGLTLDCVNPESHQLTESMWTDILDAFSSAVVNICGDEPWDLGKGRNRVRFATQRDGKARAYVEQLRRTHDLCAARGRRTHLWSDVVRNYPHLFDQMPPSSTVLHWGYDDNADYDGTAAFVAAGVDTFVCPGTSGWKRIINAMGLAERNIATFAAAGAKHGAVGLLNTDWGDHGHFNQLACSWHGIALGAVLGWKADHPIGDAFDRLFARRILNTDDPTGVRLLRGAAALADRYETWRLLWMPLHDVVGELSRITPEEADDARRHAEAFRSWSSALSPEDEYAAQDLRELDVACRFVGLLADKIDASHRVKLKSTTTAASRESITQPALSWLENVIEATAGYGECWRARNKPDGLEDVLGATTGATEDLQARERS
jgi:hypothetical protein